MAEAALTSLPPGFVVDKLPEGFVVDQPPEPDHAKANTALAKTATGVIENMKQTASDIGTLYGPAEAALNAATAFTLGFPAYLGGGVGTLISRELGIGDPNEDPQEVGKKFSNAVTYQPMSAAGRRLSEELMLPLSDLTASAEKAGHKVTDVTGSAGAGALTDATIQMLPAIVLGSIGRKLDGKTPTRADMNDAATAIVGSTDEAAVTRVADKLQATYERTGIDPPAVFRSNRENPTVVQDLASQNVEVPKAITDELPKAPAVPKAEQPTGFWQGPGGTADVEATFEKPSVAEQVKENLLNDRRWYANDTVTKNVVDLNEYRSLFKIAQRYDYDTREEISIALLDIDREQARLTALDKRTITEAARLASEGADGNLVLDKLDEVMDRLYPKAANETIRYKSVSEMVRETNEKFDTAKIEEVHRQILEDPAKVEQMAKEAKVPVEEMRARLEGAYVAKPESTETAKSFVELGRQSDEAQERIDALHDKLDKQGITFSEQLKRPDVDALYKERIALDTAAAQKGYTGAKNLVEKVLSGMPFKSTFASVDSILGERYSLTDNPQTGAYMMSKYTGKAIDSKSTIAAVANDVAKLIVARDYPNADFHMLMESNLSALTRNGREKIVREAWQKAVEINEGLRDFFTGVADASAQPEPAQRTVSAKDILEKGKAAVAAGKTPAEALAEAAPPPPPPPPPPPKPPVSGEGPPRTPAEQAILSRIVPEGEPYYVTLKNLFVEPRRTLSKIYTEAVDRWNPINVAEKAASKKFAEGVGPYEAQRLTAGVFGKGANALEHGPRKFGDFTKKVAPSLFEALDMVKDDPKGFEAYRVSKHAIEREARGLKTGFDLEAAKQVVADAGTKYDVPAMKYKQFRDAVVDYARDAGLLSGESVTAMREAYDAHVQFYRFFDDEARAMSGTQPRSPIKRAVGSERLIVDPTVSTIKDTFLFYALAEKNAARQAFISLGPDFATRVKGMKPIEIGADEVTRALKQQGIETDAEGFTAFRPQSYTVGADQIVVFEGGKRHIYQVNPEVARAFNTADSGSASLLAGMLRSTASLMRAGITLSPEFSPRNMVRDAVTSFVYAGSHPIKTVKGAISLWTKDEAYQRWMAGGGANAAFVSMDRAYINKEIFELNEKTGFMSQAWNIAKTPIETLRIVSEFMENMTRLGAVRDEMLAAKTGAKIQALSLISREATVDFAIHGADPFLQKWEGATAFMNPALQGGVRMVRAMKEDITNVLTAETHGQAVKEALTGMNAKAFVAITIPSLYLWWANHDDFRYKDLKDWERDLFWIAFHGHKTQAEWDAMSQTERMKFLDENRTDRIPKPFELGVLYGSVPERILDAYIDHNPDAFKHMGDSMFNVFAFNIIPTVGMPPLEQITNRSFFTDRPLVPNSMEKLLPELQFTPYTTQLTQALGRLVGRIPAVGETSFASPIVIDNYIRGWSGTLGTYAVQLADLGLRKTGVLPDPVRPAKTLADIPAVKAFVVRYPSAQAQSIQDFYDSYERATKIANSSKFLEKLGVMTGDEETITRGINMMAESTELRALQSTHEALRNAQQYIQLVDRNPTIKAEEKRQLIDVAYLQMIQMATAGNTIMREMQKALKETKAMPTPETVQ